MNSIVTTIQNSNYTNLPSLHEIANSRTYVIADTNFLVSDFFIDVLYEQIKQFNICNSDKQITIHVPTSCYLELNKMLRFEYGKNYTEKSASNANKILDLITLNLNHRKSNLFEITSSNQNDFADQILLNCAANMSISVPTLILTNDWSIAHDVYFHINQLSSVKRKMPIMVGRYDSKFNAFGIPSLTLIKRKMEEKSIKSIANRHAN